MKNADSNLSTLRNKFYDGKKKNDNCINGQKLIQNITHIVAVLLF